jgi:ankyrin repeat protein
MPLEIGYHRYVNLLSLKTNLAVADSSGQTALHVTVNGGHLEAVKELLEWDLERHKLPQVTLGTALHLAASLNHLKIVQALVNHGASIWYRDSSDKKTAVEVVVEHKRAPLTMYHVELVFSSPRSDEASPGWIQVARTCPLGKDDPSALYQAMRRNYERVALALMSDGEEDVFVTDNIDTTIISLAVVNMVKTEMGKSEARKTEIGEKTGSTLRRRLQFCVRFGQFNVKTSRNT